MRKLNISKDDFTSYAENHTLSELSEYFNVTKQQAKDYCRHHSIKYLHIQKEHNCSRLPQYKVWQGIIKRCCNRNSKDYKNYGARGITICTEWKDIKTFITWCNNNGYKKGLQIDRIDNNKGYSPDNCRFVTPKENMSNRRNSLVYNGVPLTKLLEDKKYNPFGLERHTVWYRLKVCGWSIDKALNTPLKYESKS